MRPSEEPRRGGRGGDGGDGVAVLAEVVRSLDLAPGAAAAEEGLKKGERKISKAQFPKE